MYLFKKTSLFFHGPLVFYGHILKKHYFLPHGPCFFIIFIKKTIFHDFWKKYFQI